MSSHRHHPTYPKPINGWDLYISSRSVSLLGGNKENNKNNSSDKKRYTLIDQHFSEPLSKRSRTSEDRLSSTYKDLSSTLTLPTTSTPITKSKHSSWKTSPPLYQRQDEDTAESIEDYLERTEPSTFKRLSTNVTSIYQQQHQQDSDESIDTFLERTEQKKSSRKPQGKDGKWKTISSLYQQQQQQQEEDSDESIDTYLERTECKKKAASYQQREREQEDAEESIDAYLERIGSPTHILSPFPCLNTASTSIDTTVVESNHNNGTDIPYSRASTTITNNAKSTDDKQRTSNYDDLFGKQLQRRRTKSGKQKDKQQQKPKETSNDPLSIDMKDLLEAITLEPLPEADPKTEKEELDFFFGNQGTRKNNKQSSNYALVNGFTGFSDDDDDDASGEY